MAFMTTPVTSDEDFRVYVKYNAKAGRWYTKEDTPDAEDFEVHPMTAVFDFPNLRTGWFLFAPGVAPVKKLNPTPGDWQPSPGEGFKRGFQINLFSRKNLLGVREFCSTAGVVIDAMNRAHTLYEQGAKANNGKLPVIACQSVKPIESKYGTNYEPQLEIVGWADRPDELVTEAAASAGAVGTVDDLADEVPF